MSADRPRRVTPHVREFLADTLTPLGVARRLATLSPVRFLFESVTGGEQVSRYSFLGAGPSELLVLWPDRLERVRGPERERAPGPALEALGSILAGYRSSRHEIPFTGGWVGYFGYDLVRMVERLPSRHRDTDGLPIAILGRFDTVVAFDHARQRVLAIANEIEGEIGREDADRALDVLTHALTAPIGGGAVPLPPDEVAPPAAIRSSLSGEAFRAAVVEAKEHIVAGDIFQVVLARRFTVPSRAAPRSLYRALRLVNPSPYMVLLELPEVALVGASPEMLVRKTADRLETRPIAGTRRRGKDAAEDVALAEDLLADPKERAEHVMLVDLGRNDLGRVAAAGTVEVEELMKIERYSHVMHIVSGVEAEIAVGRDGLDALLACFPAGTVSGAPKVRAMEIIDELEPEPRGPYAGAVGYLSYTGDVDTCITIRTLVVRGGETSVTAGAGIVADSDPALEQLETENKAAAMLAAVALADRLESDAETPGTEPVARGVIGP